MTRDTTTVQATPPVIWRGAELRTLLALVLGVLVVYLVTASSTVAQNNDTRAAALAAWSLGTRGTVELPVEWRDDPVSWPVETGDGRLFVNRLPGPILWGAPFYAAAELVAPAGDVVHPHLVPYRPAGVASAVLAALAVGVSYVGFRRLVERRVAVGAALVLAFATSVWSISADALWTHGLTHLGLAIGLLAAAVARPGRAGLGFAVSILARPHTAVVAACVGLGEGLRERRLRPVLLVAAGSVLGVVALLAYSRLVFGVWSLTAGFSGVDVESSRPTGPVEFVRRVGAAFLDPRRGLFVYAPFVVVLLVGVRAGWRVAPTWVRSAAVGGVAYTLAQLVLNRASGGDHFFAYRLTIELLVLTAPLLLLGWEHAFRGRRWLQTLLAASVLASVGVQAVGATVRSSAYYTREYREAQVTELCAGPEVDCDPANLLP